MITIIYPCTALILVVVHDLPWLSLPNKKDNEVSLTKVTLFRATIYQTMSGLNLKLLE
jgi:hypothetical protein